jgi:hypothetical protein
MCARHREECLAARQRGNRWADNDVDASRKMDNRCRIHPRQPCRRYKVLLQLDDRCLLKQPRLMPYFRHQQCASPLCVQAKSGRKEEFQRRGEAIPAPGGIAIRLVAGRPIIRTLE